ncbi:hypothetical protein AVEN_12141-1 [Araneus ventricosus]|uniref:Uncharacterized protein n=1 Tax=Araneus ventricosus TaxID=182803 RepID=A0A4Y2X6E0_ARAVE|nr:hypothetical protein AVEN_12141-1 [Araneus ventricosus]
MGYLKVLQINVNHSSAAHCHTFVVAEENVVDFLRFQDPYISDNVPVTGGKGCRMFCSFNNKPVTYCLNKDLDIVLGHNTNHIVGLFVKLGVLELQIISAYFAPHDSIDSSIEEFTNFNSINKNVLILGTSLRGHSYGTTISKMFVGGQSYIFQL